MRFNSVVTALAVMYAAEKYMVSRINNLALKFINKNANSDNVLMILQHLYVLHQREHEDEEVHYTPSAPPLELLEQVDMGKKQEQLHLALLEHICKSFPATSTGCEEISLRSGADTPILVSPTGLILLERAQEKGCRNVVLGPVHNDTAVN